MFCGLYFECDGFVGFVFECECECFVWVDWVEEFGIVDLLVVFGVLLFGIVE